LREKAKMNDKTSQGYSTDRDDATMERLLRLAGPRAPIPEDIAARVYQRVHREWQASSQPPDGARVYQHVRKEWQKRASRRRYRRWVLPVALAASVVLAVTMVLQPPPSAPDRVSIGTVARVIGDAGTAALPAIGQPVYAGDVLQTGSGEKLSVVINNAESLRLDEDTTLAFVAKDEFRLDSGRVYADTGDFMYRNRGLIIETAMGSVTDVGTQFAVQIGGDSLDVAVREGRVDISRGASEYVAVAGERMQLGPDDVTAVEALEAHDPFWSWTTSLAPVFDIENKSLLDFLRWAARETGRELEFEDNELRMSAMRTDLHGSVSDFEPIQAVESVLATTNFRYRIRADRIIIQR
jgi:ferric-dicitrate binding protein FerR (iron transport regulator)